MIDRESGKVIACRIKVGMSRLSHCFVQTIDKTLFTNHTDQLFRIMRNKPGIVEGISFRKSGRMIRVERFYPFPVLVFRTDETGFSVKQVIPVVRPFVK